MPDTAFAKVENAFAEALRTWPDLAGYTVVTDRSVDIAPEDNETDKQIAIYTAALAHDNSDEHGQTVHAAMIEFEVTSSAPGLGLGSANLETIALIVAALSQDRTLGGRLQDWQEIDTVSPATNGKDVSAASLQIRAQFFTSRTDWFTLLGQGGLTF